jgi:hypothetical protein
VIVALLLTLCTQTTTWQPPTLAVRWQNNTAQPGRLLVLEIDVAADVAPIKQLTIELDGKSGVAWPVDDTRRRFRGLAPIEIEHALTTAPLLVHALLDDGRLLERALDVALTSGGYDRRNIRVARRFTSPSKAEQQRADDEAQAMAAAQSTSAPLRLWSGSWLKPTAGEPTAPFGTLRTYNKKRRSRHLGLDLDGDVGTPVVAAARGRVVLAVDRFFSGGTVVLDHGEGLFSMVFHLSRIDVGVGQLVAQGAPLGAVGASGQVTGPHLHFTVKLDGVSVDPAQLLALDLESAQPSPPTSSASSSESSSTSVLSR